ENLWPVKFLFELLLIVASPVKLGTRVQAAEVGMTADMIPVGVRNQHSCKRRQSWCIGLQRIICAFREVRSGACVNADELMPILGNNEIVFREFEAGQRVDATRNHLFNAPRRKRMTGGFVLGKRRRQCDWMLEGRITTAPQVFLGFCHVSLIKR